MLITREIDGKIVQFELTATEMEAAYDEQYRKTPNWFGQVRWCNADLIAALEEKGYPASEHNIGELRCRCKHHTFTDSMIQEGWGTIYCILEDLANEGNLQKEGNQETNENDRWHINNLRVVLDCYYADDPRPYADFIDKFFKNEDDAQSAVNEAVKQELETLNQCEILDIEDCNHLVFRASLQAEDAATVRMWDGDDYRIVTRYNIYKLFPAAPIAGYGNGIYYRHHGLYFTDGEIVITKRQDEDPGYKEILRVKDLDNALVFVDQLLLEANQREKKRKE